MKVWALTRWFLAVTVSVCAQESPIPSLGPLPQANTQQEFDDWLDLVGSSDPQGTVRLANEFLAQYPRSGFAARVYQAQMLAYQQLDNYEAALDAGRKALRLSPDNLHVLAEMANLVPHGVPPDKGDDPRLDEAEGYARRILSRLPELKIPRSLPIEEWKRIRLRLEMSAHSALGLVALARAQPQPAIRELEWVTTRSSDADGVQFLRLGSAYAMAKDFCSASRAFERASTLGPEPVRQRARQGMQNLASRLSGCASAR